MVGFGRKTGSGAAPVTLWSFGGYCRRADAPAGAWYDETNLSARSRPALCTRPPRSAAGAVAGCGGLLGREALWAVEGPALRCGEQRYDLGLTAGDKQLVSMGAYLLIWPDKKYINTVTPADRGSMEQVNTARGVTARLCRADGRPLTPDHTGPAAPADPGDGCLWLDTAAGALKVWRSDAMVWSQETSTWVRAEGSGLGRRLRAGDGVTVTGLGSLDGTAVLQDAGEDYVVLPGLLPEAYAPPGPVTVGRTVPDLDYVTECDNRIWGCRRAVENGEAVNEIRCCKLGDFRNWHCFAGLSTDSYAAARGSDGPWTGAATWGGQPVFFKERSIERVYPSPTGAHRIVSVEARGVQQGSWRSLRAVNGTLLYLSDSGVCAYTGALPVSVSEDLGPGRWRNGRAGASGDLYYISMQSAEDGTWHLFTYDVKAGLWHREDNTRARCFASLGSRLYWAEEDTGALVCADGGDEDAPLPWAAESAPLDRRRAGRYVSRFLISCDTRGRVRLQLRYDDGPWLDRGAAHGAGACVLTLPVPPRRCARVAIRLSGDRPCRIDSLTACWEKGSDRVW